MDTISVIQGNELITQVMATGTNEPVYTSTRISVGKSTLRMK
jgi:hypothetical protein